LATFPDVLEIYNAALQKYEAGIFTRNLLDDLRLALEKLLQEVLDNSKSLENQLATLGEFIKERGASREFANMFRHFSTTTASIKIHTSSMTRQSWSRRSNFYLS
jgi:Zn-dependent M32 family carboxypeptidase